MASLDVPKITDYTTLTDLEKFSSYIEKFIILWHLSLDEINNFSNAYDNDEFDKRQYFTVFDVNFVIELYINKLECNNIKILYNNFLNEISNVKFLPNNLHYINQKYGVSNFILIKTKSDVDIIKSEKFIKSLNSGINLAINNSKCVVPVFLQTDEKIKNIYYGFFINFGIRSIFDLVYFKNGLPHLISESDFFKLFESKFKTKLRYDNTVLNSFKNVRTLSNVKIDQITQADLSKTEIYADLISINTKFGSQTDFLNKIIKNLEYAEIWEEINGTSWIDQLFYYSFKPFESKKSEISLEFNNDVESFILKSVFYSFDNLLDIAEYWGKSEINNLVVCLNENLLHDITKKTYINIREKLLNFFFTENENLDFIDKTYIQFKTCKSNNILFRFAFFVHNLHANYPDLDILILFLWKDFVEKLRRYYETNELIPCIEDTKMEYDTCLLNKKIQILNFCIKKKREQEIVNLSRNSEEDEFFDCQEEMPKNNEDSFEGEKKSFNNIKSLTSGKLLYIPTTLELFPLSTTCLQKYDELEKFEFFKQSGKLNEKDLLASDMKAFKAANPNCCFQDFIRWYSPRDFIEECYDENTGQMKVEAHLSDRFKSEDCVWKNLWNSCEPLSVTKQKCYLNYKLEAEQILKDLDSLQINVLYKLLLSVLCHISIYKYNLLVNELSYDKLEFKFNYLMNEISSACSNLNENQIKNNLLLIDKLVYEYLAVTQLIRKSYLRIECNNKYKNDEILKLVLDLVPNLIEQKHICFPSELNSYTNLILRKIFDLNSIHPAIYMDSKNDLIEDYTYRELIFTVQLPRPAPGYSKCLPQKMHCTAIKNSSIRFNSCFTEDVIYF